MFLFGISLATFIFLNIYIYKFYPVIGSDRYSRLFVSFFKLSANRNLKLYLCRLVRHQSR